MTIDVHIPYDLNGNIAEAYNSIMRGADSDWALIVEHDVFVACNPLWYRMCVEAIRGSDTIGMITCVTSGSRKRNERPQGAYLQSQSSNLDDHVEIARKCSLKYGVKVEIHDTKYMAGYFMLINKKAWQEVPFEDQGKGVHKVDQAFCQGLIDKGYHIGVMKGLYVYHRKKVRELKW